MESTGVEVRLRLYKRVSLETDLRSWVNALRAVNAGVRVIERSGEQWVYVDEHLSNEWIEHCLFASMRNPDVECSPGQNRFPLNLEFKRLVESKLVILVCLMTLLCAVDTGLGERLARVNAWLIVDFYQGLSGLSSGYIPAATEGVHRGLEWSYRLIAPIFLHFGTMHLVFNGLWWWVLGRPLELRFGSGLLLMLVLSGGVVSNVVQYWYVPELPLFGGLSGVIYVLVGFVMVWNGFSKRNKLPIPHNLMVLMVVWLLLCMTGVMEMFGVHVANAAHLSGWLWGVMAGFFTTVYAERKQA